MTRRNLALALCLTAAMPACTAPDRPPVPPEENLCGAAGLQHLVGQPEQALTSMTFATPTRLIPPNTPVTLDYNPARLNFAVDGAGKIIRVTCG